MKVHHTSSADLEDHVDIDLHSVKLPVVAPPLDRFDPRKVRNPTNPIKPWMAYLIMMRSVFGAGALSLPMAISQVGYVVGILLMLFTGLLLINTQLCLLWCLNECSRQLRIPYLNYRYGFRLTLLHGPECLARWGDFGAFCSCNFTGSSFPLSGTQLRMHVVTMAVKIGRSVVPTQTSLNRRSYYRCIVGVVMLLSQISICTVFVIFTAHSLRDIADFQSYSTALGCLLVPYLLMAVAMKNLRIISYVSMMGNIMNVIGLSLTFIQIFRDPRKKMTPAVVEPLPILFSFGTMLFNLSTIAVIVVLDRSLKNPTLLLGKTGMISVGTLASTTVGCVFGVFGYWSYGTMEENILRSLPFDDELSLSAIGIYMFSIAFTYPLQCYPGLYIISQMIGDRSTHRPTEQFMHVVEVVARPCFVLVTFFISYLCPFQAAFVAFVGNLCTTLLAIVFPSVMELCLRYPNDYGCFKIYLIKNILIMIVGFITWVFGIVMCGYLIYIRILSLSSPNNYYD